MLILNPRNSASRRGKFLRNRNRTMRPAGPYRPSRLPTPSRHRRLGGFFLILALMVLGFSLAHIWKAHEVSRLCTRMDALRTDQQELAKKLKTQQLILQELSTYSKIEPLARERLGMLPSPEPPVVLAPLEERRPATALAARENHPGQEGK
ncbi:MAG: hypothetical protein C4524_05135 [Candidatus Zixiibacteriota bacterium]|nr:MAG: hypothetical protein C4524_05135 [candidate division Zixibacteria bacterium]